MINRRRLETGGFLIFLVVITIALVVVVWSYALALLWAALAAIPFGETISYAELARRVGSPAAVRAVGGANGRNPIPIIVPCHRVIGADGSLTGFGGGLERKRWLLKHEGASNGPPGGLWRGGDHGGILA